MATSSHVSIAATVVGASHVSSGRPGEDWFAISSSDDGRWTSAAVCDGCGSVPHALEGAKFISVFISKHLAAMASTLNARGPGEWTVDRVVTIVAELREAMRANFKKPIADYSATIVAAMISRTGGFIVHIGDGVASTFSTEKSADGPALRVTGQSDPENGEYANETYYVTAPDWLRHLRVTPLGSTDCVLLCTDGAQSYLYQGSDPHLDEITTVLRELAPLDEDEANVRLGEILSGSQACRLSNDDKTVVVLAERTFWRNARALARPQASAAAPVVATASASSAAVSGASPRQPGTSGIPAPVTSLGAPVNAGRPRFNMRMRQPETDPAKLGHGGGVGPSEAASPQPGPQRRRSFFALYVLGFLVATLAVGTGLVASGTYLYHRFLEPRMAPSATLHASGGTAKAPAHDGSEPGADSSKTAPAEANGMPGGAPSAGPRSVTGASQGTSPSPGSAVDPPNSDASAEIRQNVGSQNGGSTVAGPAAAGSASAGSPGANANDSSSGAPGAPNHRQASHH